MNHKIMGEMILARVKADGYSPEMPAVFFGGLELDKKYLGLFGEVLKSLEDNFDIVLTKKDRIVMPESLSLYKGTFMSTAKNYGFVAVEGDYFAGDIFVSQANINGAVSGDRVLVRVREPEDSGSRREASVEKILSRAENKFMGVVELKNGEYYIVSKAYGGVLIVRLEKNNLYLPDNSDSAEVGDIVEAEIIKYPQEQIEARRKRARKSRAPDKRPRRAQTDGRAYGRITRIFGASGSLYANYDFILAEHNIRTEFSRRVIAEAAAAAEERSDTGDRLDLRGKLVFTIDGEDAKDLDDAISLEFDGEGNYVLGVHIADVSRYVTQNSRTDREAFERGTSVYFADKVVPMLPPVLSNGICSLNAGEDRLTMSAFITLDNTGKTISSSFAKSIINSKIRGVYSEINSLFEDPSSPGKYKPVMKILPKFRRLAKLLKKRRVKRGSLELSSIEPVFTMEYDELLGESYPTDIKPRVNGEAEGMIEEFMLCANEAVAEYLYSQGYPCVYRVHERPIEEKINSFLDTAREMGVYSSKKTAVSQKDLQTIIDNSRNTGLFDVINAMLLRSMAKAKYSAECLGHYGLACGKYLHFTSPIRRYPDLTVHRILKLALDRNLPEAKKQFSQFVKEAALKSSEREVEALRAEREIEDLYKCVYMHKRIGEEFDGIIRGVTRFGFFVALENTCEGLVRIQDLGGEYEYDPARFELRDGKKRFAIGEKVRVKVVAASVESQNVDFELVRVIP